MSTGGNQPDNQGSDTPGDLDAGGFNTTEFDAAVFSSDTGQSYAIVSKQGPRGRDMARPRTLSRARR